jgi:hypothetical protein
MWLLLSNFKAKMTKVNKRQRLEKVGQKTKLLLLCGKRQKYLTKVPPFDFALLLVLRCLAVGGL